MPLEFSCTIFGIIGIVHWYNIGFWDDPLTTYFCWFLLQTLLALPGSVQLWKKSQLNKPISHPHSVCWLREEGGVVFLECLRTPLMNSCAILNPGMLTG